MSGEKLSTGQKVFLGFFALLMVGLGTGAQYASSEARKQRRPKNFYEAKRLPIPRPEDV